MDSLYKYDGTPLDLAKSYKLRISSMGRIDDGIDSAYVDGSEYSLCGVRNKMFDGEPSVPIGWLYQRSPVNKQGIELWYSANQIDKPKLLTTITGCKPNDLQRVFAISPTHGDIISCMRNSRNVPIVYDASENQTSTVSGLSTNPVGWVREAGSDFGIDGNDNEYFMFGEYHGQPSSQSAYANLLIWKVSYPYTDANNWKVVLSVPRASKYENGVPGTEPNKPWHCHTVMRDPYTNIWYVTTGDSDTASLWWYSTDHGETWTQLISSPIWDSQTARMLNFAFEKDYVYWGNDYAVNHSVNRVSRLQSGVIDINSHERVAELNKLQSTYATIHLDYPRGLLFLDRVDTAFSTQTNELHVEFFSFDDEHVYDLMTIKRSADAEELMFGFKCKSYTNRQSPYDPRIGVGFDIGSKNFMDLTGNENFALWTLFLEVI